MHPPRRTPRSIPFPNASSPPQVARSWSTPSRLGCSSSEPLQSPSPMAADGTTTAPASSPPTVGTLLTRASAAGDSHRGCSSPRSLLSRILHRGRGGRGGAGFGCRLRLLPRYCASASAAAAEEDAVAAKHEEEDKQAEVAAPTAVAVAAAQPARREPGSPRSALGKDALPASLGLGASLVLLLSKSAAELSRMAELRAQMERLLLDARADVRSCNGRPSASGDRTDCASVVKGPVASAGGDGSRASTAAPASRGASEDGGRRDMDRMEAELEAELSRLQLQRDSDDEDSRDDHQLEAQEGPKSRIASSESRSAIFSDSDNYDGEIDNNSGGGGDESQDRYDDEEEDEDEDEDDERKTDEVNGIRSPPHGGVSARELERRLHQLLQSRHEARIAELESALERARQKLLETEREACRWRDTAKLATRFADESRLR